MLHLPLVLSSAPPCRAARVVVRSRLFLLWTSFTFVPALSTLPRTFTARSFLPLLISCNLWCFSCGANHCLRSGARHGLGCGRVPHHRLAWTISNSVVHLILWCAGRSNERLSYSFVAEDRQWFTSTVAPRHTRTLSTGNLAIANDPSGNLHPGSRTLPSWYFLQNLPITNEKFRIPSVPYSEVRL